jgi:hypothetical protein
MTRQSLIRIGAGIAIAGFVGLAASPAFATTSSTTPAPGSKAVAISAAALQKIQAAAAAAISAREAALGQAVTVLNAHSSCGVGTMVSTATGDESALTTLGQTIQADTTVAAAKNDSQSIFQTYRVFALVLPVDHMVLADCALTALLPKFTALETKWAALNDQSITSLLADMQTRTTDAGTALGQVSPSALEADTPTEWNSNHDLLAASRSSLQSARQDLGKARDDAKQIVNILHQEHQQGGKNVASVTTSTAPASTSTTAAS